MGNYAARAHPAIRPGCVPGHPADTGAAADRAVCGQAMDYGVGKMSADVIEQMSEALADRVAAAACVVAVRAGHRHVSGILWQPEIVVTSEQLLGERTEFTVAHRDTTVPARLVG